MTNNYEKQVLTGRKLFLKYDQQEMLHKFQLQADETAIYLPLLNQLYRVIRNNGQVEEMKKRPESDSDLFSVLCTDYNIVMTIYDLLCYSKETPVLAHQWVPLNELQVTLSSPSADIFSQPYANAFSQKADLLLEICQEIGGRKPEITASADVCWEFDLFPFFPVQLRFWDKDEEFPPQIRLLWDKNTLKFMHFETTYYAMNILLSTLKKYFDDKTESL